MLLKTINLKYIILNLKQLVLKNSIVNNERIHEKKKK